MLPRFCEYEVKKLRSSACCRQENAIFSPHIHRTWYAYFSPFLYKQNNEVTATNLLLGSPSKRKFDVTAANPVEFAPLLILLLLFLGVRFARCRARGDDGLTAERKFAFPIATRRRERDGGGPQPNEL